MTEHRLPPLRSYAPALAFFGGCVVLGVLGVIRGLATRNNEIVLLGLASILCGGWIVLKVLVALKKLASGVGPAYRGDVAPPPTWTERSDAAQAVRDGEPSSDSRTYAIQREIALKVLRQAPRMVSVSTVGVVASLAALVFEPLRPMGIAFMVFVLALSLNRIPYWLRMRGSAKQVLGADRRVAR